MKKWPSRWQKFWFRIAQWWLKRNGFLTGYDDGIEPGDEYPSIPFEPKFAIGDTIKIKMPERWLP